MGFKSMDKERVSDGCKDIGLSLDLIDSRDEIDDEGWRKAGDELR